MDKDKVIEAAKLNLIKYIFDESANEIQLSELKKVGIGSFIDGAEWMAKQGELPEGCVRKQVAEAKEALYYAPCADTINGQGITNQVSQSEVTKISEQVPSLLDLKLMDCPLSVKTISVVKVITDKAARDVTLGDLVKCTKEELLGLRNFGKTSLKEIEVFLAEYGLKLKGE
jgi:hypothetical protein